LLFALGAVCLLAACGGGESPRSAKPRPSAAKEAAGNVVDIRRNDEQQKLVDALAQPDTTVRLAEGLDMDLSGYDPIRISKGVTLTSVGSDDLSAKGGANIRRPPVGAVGRQPARSARKLGPRLYVNAAYYAKAGIQLPRPNPLFLMRCGDEGDTPGLAGDNVRISDFRIHGPHFETQEGDEYLEKAIQIRGCTGIEIANMEIAGWSGQAIYIVDDEFNRITEPQQIRIHDNFIHHNQHKGGNGYGVVTQVGAFALIERNVFDFNRHAIASNGTSDPGKETGYRAEQNLVLRGGGVHGTFYNEHTHQFDVHGDRTCGIGDKNCGWAGNRLWYLSNAFQYTIDNDIKLRGRPREFAYIEGNVFPHSSFDDAVNLRTRKNVHGDARNNTLGVDTFGQYGVCDLDGDGKDDLFLPTGVNWWYSSGARMHWSYLRPASERIGELGLGYFDGDKRCDVLAVHGSQWEISSGGTGAWTSLGAYGVPFDQLRFGKFSGATAERPGGRALTDIFRRAPDGKWSIVTPGKQDWRDLGSSSFPLSDLGFGDFTGDGVTDVFGIAGGRWSISRSGTGSWERLNPKLATPVKSVLIADVNGNGTDDVVQLSSDKWQVSWEGRSDWQALKSLPSLQALESGNYPRFAGQFDGLPGLDLLVVDGTRFGRLYSKANDAVVVHNLFAY
jgi:hypothetical protein